MRDYVIGVTAIDASGRLFKAGGRVVKNVAGYDLCKVLVGSLGTLGIITQVTLKLRPLPESSVILWTTYDRLGTIDEVLERLSKSAARPVALDVLDSHAAAAVAAEAVLDLPTHRPVLCVGVEGTAPEAAWQMETLQSEISPFSPHEIVPVSGAGATKLWFALTEFQVPSDDPLTFKANLLPSRTVDFVNEAQQTGCAVQGHAGSGIVIGHLPDLVTTVGAAGELIARLRGRARKCRGNLVVVDCDDSWKNDLPMFGDPEPSWPLMRRLKRELDPQNLLNPHYSFGSDLPQNSK
jgi:glycolate oxidase FAD binding subunit